MSKTTDLLKLLERHLGGRANVCQNGLFNCVNKEGNYIYFHVTELNAKTAGLTVIPSKSNGDVPQMIAGISTIKSFHEHSIVKGELSRKWKDSLVHCQPALLDNIVRLLTIHGSEKVLEELHKELLSACGSYELLKLKGFYKNTKVTETFCSCVEMIFLLLMDAIGANLDGSPVIKAGKELSLPEREIKNFSGLLEKEIPYFPQSLFVEDEAEPVFSLSDTAFENGALDALRRVLVQAPGGQGKSLFLRRLQERAVKQQCYERVLRIELAELLRVSDEQLRGFPPCQTKRLFWQLQEQGEDLDALIPFLNKKTDKRVLVLLDGLNEVFASTDFNKIQSIFAELAYITDEWSNATFVMTSRALDEARSFLNAYRVCTLSGTPQDKVKGLLMAHPELREEIKSLASIPMYYHALSKLSNQHQVKTKYDLLLQLYLERYRQSAPLDADTFYAFFILAPFVARAIHDSQQNSIALNTVVELAKTLGQKNLTLLIQAALQECGLPPLMCQPNPEQACAILLYHGPFRYVADRNQGQYQIYHDEIRDFLLAFSAVITMKAMQAALGEGQFAFVKDLHLNLNLKDDPARLFKSRLGLTCGQDILHNLAESYQVLENCQLTPQAVLLAHSLFLISDYLSFGSEAVSPVHEILWPFTRRIVRFVRQGNFAQCLKEYNVPVDQENESRLRQAVADICSKHCEYYRQQEMFEEGLDLANVALQIQPDSDAIKNQKSKLLLYMYQSHVKDGRTYPLKQLGFSDYAAMYLEGRRLLDEAASHDFNLSVNVVGGLLCVPAPYLVKETSLKVPFDFIKAFHLYRGLLFTSQQVNYTAKEISYTVRQIVGLLLKGYVKFNPVCEVFESGDPGPNAVVLGDRNTLTLDADTVAMAKYFLSMADGMEQLSLDYYRGVVAYYEGDLITAEKLFSREKDKNLCSVFQHYRMDASVELEPLYSMVFSQMENPSLDVMDRCHPVYWYCDMKNLELAFDKTRASYFSQREETLSPVLKAIVEQLTPPEVE